jgi:hypothetical protein
MLENLVTALLVIPAAVFAALFVYMTMYVVAKALGFRS